MGFYVRRSVKAGPFRFNLSKSGVGVSAGVPGFRVGTGPRGNYIHMGRGGVYYRGSLAPGSRGPGPGRAATVPAGTYDPNAIIMEDVTGATTLDMHPTGGGDVVDQLNAAAKHFSTWWIAAIAAFVIGAAILPWGILVWVLAAPICWWLFQRDAAKRKVVLFYDVNDSAATWFDSLVAQWPWFTDAQKLWRTVSSGQVQTLYQHKTNAGASNLVRKESATATLAGPKHLATNVAVPTINAGSASIHFLPDRLLIREGKHYTDASYRALNAVGSRQRFIESPGVIPKDSQQVGQTWQYVNKGGGPDRRFANNPILPIMLYSDLELRTAQGLSWEIQCSRPDAGPSISRTIAAAPIDELAP